MTERSGKRPVCPIPLSLMMTIRARLEDTIDCSSADASLLIVSDSYVGPLPASHIDTRETFRVTDTTRVAAQTRDSVQTAVTDMTATETIDAVTDAPVTVVALQRDQQTLLVAQRLRTQFEVDAIVILLNDPERREAFDHVATSIACVSTCRSPESSPTFEQMLPELPAHS